MNDSLRVANGAADAAKSQVVDLNAKMDDLQKVNDALTKTNDDLMSANSELTDDLSFFVVPADSSASSGLSVVFGGVLAGGGKNEYSVTATSGLKVFVKNSADANVDAALSPLVGQAVQISGTHALGSREITITAVNGNSVQ